MNLTLYFKNEILLKKDVFPKIYDEKASNFNSRLWVDLDEFDSLIKATNLYGFLLGELSVENKRVIGKFFVKDFLENENDVQIGFEFIKT